MSVLKLVWQRGMDRALVPTRTLVGAVMLLVLSGTIVGCPVPGTLVSAEEVRLAQSDSLLGGSSPNLGIVRSQLELAVDYERRALAALRAGVDDQTIGEVERVIFEGYKLLRVAENGVHLKMQASNPHVATGLYEPIRTRILEAIAEVYWGGAPMSSNIARMIVHSFQMVLHSPLTKRENDILAHMCKGMSYKSIADNLFISQETVRSHIKHVYQKLHVHSKSEAIAKAFRERLVRV